jgi:hypothetical protein
MPYEDGREKQLALARAGIVQLGIVSPENRKEHILGRCYATARKRAVESIKLDSGGSLESLYTNYSVCLRHLTGYLSQKDDSERKALLAVLRNIAFNKHQDLGRPVDEATIHSCQRR